MKTPYMMIEALALLVAVAVPLAHPIEGLVEFGEVRGLKPEMKNIKKVTISLPKIKAEEFLRAESQGFWESLNSMSMSFDVPTVAPAMRPSTPSAGPTAAPAAVRPSSSSAPTRMPTSTYAPGCPGCPPWAPAASDAPSAAPTLVKSVAPVPSNMMSKPPSVIMSKLPTFMMMSNRPTTPPASAAPTKSPSSPTAPSPTKSPAASSTIPTITSSPTTPPSTTTGPTATTAPSSSASPTRVPCEGPCFDIIFRCSANNVVIEAQPPATTTIDFNVGYVVETTSLLEDFVQPLEALILETAVQGALQCGEGGPLFGPGGNPPQILMFTSMTGDDCDPQVDGSTCIVLETKFTLLVKENLNPDLGAFLGYMELQKNMDNGTFIEAIPQLDRIEYLKPLPLLPPITGPSPAPAPVNGESSQLSVSSWTIGAVVAMCIGGTIAIAAWARNRRTRNQRHMQLLEEMSSTSPPAPVSTPPEQPAVATTTTTTTTTPS